MKRSLKIIFGILLALVVIVLIGNYIAKLQLNSALDDFSKSNTLQYQGTSVNLLFGNASVDSISYSDEKTSIESSTISVKGFNYVDYLFSDTIRVEDIVITNPKIALKPKTKSKKENATKSNSNFKKVIVIENFSLEKGFLERFKTEEIKNLSVNAPHFKMTKVVVDSASLARKLPFSYKVIQANLDSLYLYINKYEDFKVNSISIKNNQVTAKDLRILPKFGRNEFQKVIPYEKDLITLKVPQVSLANFKLENYQEDLLFTTSMINLDQPNCNIYRDKNAPDDTRQKPMYSEMLRDLPFGLQVDTLAIHKGHLIYEEKAVGATKPGKLIFANMEADVNNIVNVSRGEKPFPKTKLNIASTFMKDARLEVDWQFDVSNKNDRFNIKGVGYNISANDINPFLIPAVNAKAEGNLKEVYFNYSGNATKAIGDMRINYDKFKIEILRKDGKKKNGLLSGLLNLFIIDNNEENGTVLKENIEATRDKTRSFWNYFWICIKNGAVKVLTSKS